MNIFRNLSSFSMKSIGLTLLVALLFAFAPALVPNAMAASVTSFSVLLSREKAAVQSNYTVTFTTPTGIAASATLILTFDNSTDIDAVTFADIDLKDDGVDVTLAATAAGASWGVDPTSSTVLTFTNGSAAVAAGSVVEIEIGTHATGGAEQITNGSAGTTKLVLSGTFGDSGTAAIPIIAEDQVTITATVAPTITFAISDTSIGFGTLSSSQATWANGAGTGSATDTSAHTLAVATNATGGYAITYNGATLTSGSDTISVASINNDANGTPGTEEFGLSLSTDGDGTIATGYNHGDPDWTWVAGTTTTIFSETGPTATETVSAYYLANIAGNTEAGSYSTTVTYIATATF